MRTEVHAWSTLDRRSHMLTPRFSLVLFTMTSSNALRSYVNPVKSAPCKGMWNITPTRRDPNSAAMGRKAIAALHFRCQPLPEHTMAACRWVRAGP